MAEIDEKIYLYIPSIYIFPMTIKEHEQPTYLKGEVLETAINTFTVYEISVPRILSDRMLFDIDEIVIDVTRPASALGADSMASVNAQLVISENEPTGMLDYQDGRVLAALQRAGFSSATDFLFTTITKGMQVWASPTHANLVPDDKIWLLVQGTNNKAARVCTGTVRIKGKLSKVSAADFEALIMSRLG